jgi:hypothetical protein
VSSIGRELRENLFREGRFPLDWTPETTDRAAERLRFAQEMKKRILSYERSCEVAVGVIAAGGYYGKEGQVGAFRELVELAVSSPGPVESAHEVWKRLKLYPALLLLYTGGVAATAAENWPFLKMLLKDSLFADMYGTSPLGLKVYPWAVDWDKGLTNAALFNDVHFYEPMAEWLYRTLREPLEKYLPLDVRYDIAFNKFEVLHALAYIDGQKKQVSDENDLLDLDWVPLGRFALVEKTGRGRDSTLTTMSREYDEQGPQWPPVKGVY